MEKIDLAGLWHLDCSKEGFQTIPARIPGENCSALIEAGIVPDPYIGFNENEIQWVREYTWSWSREFDVSPEFLEQTRIWLNIDSLDTTGEVRLNGKTVLSSRNMFIRIRRDVKEFLHAGTNTIQVIVHPVEEYTRKEAEKIPLKVGAARRDWRKMDYLNLVRKIQCQGGWDWGPCIPVSGMYGDVSISGSNGIRIEHVYTEQHHAGGSCRLDVTVEVDALQAMTQEFKFTFGGREKVLNAELRPGMNKVSTSFEITAPRLWYPAGYGEQFLYELSVTADSCRTVKKIGLRDLKTVSHPDEHGICLYFEVNGIPVFAKGANWIPMDGRPQSYTRERYDKLLSDAVSANMNTLRVWGGGLYENEDFYELCDEKGLLLWHDCMFACTHYPSTPDFLALIGEELEYQIKRLRDHAAIALWCGDNECGTILRGTLPEDLDRILNYDRFNQAVGKAVKSADPTRVFWPTSPCNSQEDSSGWNDDTKGDMHYWNVWHKDASFEAYYDVTPRFCSEFGYQSFPSLNTVDFFTQGKQRNVTSPLMEHHQRNNSGNSKIVEMFTRYFRLPGTFEDFIYLSQVQQAVAIKSGVEFWRTLKPHCMGTIYWQLNDNWPVASWSSLDYFGHWKQLHYHARRFYAPVLVTAFRKTTETVEVHISSDMKDTLQGELTLSLYKVDGTLVSQRQIPVTLAPRAAAGLAEFPLAELTSTPAEDFLYLEFHGESGSEAVHCTNECFPARYKEYQLQDPEIRHKICRAGDGTMYLELTAGKPAFYVFAEFRGAKGIFEDNSLTLLPGKTVRLQFTVDRDLSDDELEKMLEIRHLQGSYRE